MDSTVLMNDGNQIKCGINIALNLSHLTRSSTLLALNHRLIRWISRACRATHA